MVSERDDPAGAGNREVVLRIRAQAADEALRLTIHAHQQMVEDDYSLDDVLHALRGCRLLEDYPDDRRGPSHLVLGYTASGRPMHVVCAVTAPVLVIITVYEPKAPRWTSPTERRHPR